MLLKFLVKVYISRYLLNMLMDIVDTLHIDRYWSQVLCCSIMTHLDGLETWTFFVKDLVNICLEHVDVSS